MELKDDFPLTRNRIWFNTAATGACPSTTLAVMEEYSVDIMGRLRGEGGISHALGEMGGDEAQQLEALRDDHRRLGGGGRIRPQRERRRQHGLRNGAPREGG